MFEQQDYRTKKRPTRPLYRLSLRTKTQGTHVPGLCRYDSVEVKFEPTASTSKRPTAPSKAVGLQSTSHFLFRSPPAGEYEELAGPTPVSEKDCERLSKDRPFFTAATETEATNGYLTWLRLLDAVRKNPKLSLDCNLTPAEKGVPCAQALASMKPDDLWAIEDCDPPSYETECWKLYAADRLITVTTRAHIYPGPPPGEIVSAKVGTLITFADRIID